MNEHLKLSLWDAFAYFISGWAVMLSIYAQLIYIGLPINEELNKIPKTALGFAAVLSPLILGLLFEPIANLTGDIVFKSSKFLFETRRNLYGRLKNKEYPNTKKAEQKLDGFEFLEAQVAKDIPNTLVKKFDSFHWAKDYLLQEKIDTPYMDFLAKFGFYRNIGTLLLLNAVVLVWIHDFKEPCLILVYIALVLSSWIYFGRSWAFFKHVGKSAYRHYLILDERSKRSKRSS